MKWGREIFISQCEVDDREKKGVLGFDNQGKRGKGKASIHIWWAHLWWALDRG